MPYRSPIPQFQIYLLVMNYSQNRQQLVHQYEDISCGQPPPLFTAQPAAFLYSITGLGIDFWTTRTWGRFFKDSIPMVDPRGLLYSRH